ncbi:hypothetical protein [Roseinatronobacter sp. NSM]|uniref:hypothetical protein n=1 Tax=Roseinatronobacter sp. NSM TaxID=3457785 RepID=UPI004037225A
MRAANTWVALAEVQREVIWPHPDLEADPLIPVETEMLRIDAADDELALAQSQADLAARATLLARRTVADLESTL